MTGAFRRGGNLDADIQREDDVKTQGEGGCLQAERPGTAPSLTVLRRQQPCRHDLGILDSRTVRK